MKKRLPALTVFLGSFLLFGIQPMLGRTLLPSFGGTAAVWTVCLAAYQTLLLAGYFYAHAVSQLPLKSQRRLHLGLLALSLPWTSGLLLVRPLITGMSNGSAPALEVLLCVVVLAGLPYVLLAAGSSLVQSWLSNERGRTVYRLYAVSNAGSFLGLLAYPFAFEPFVSLSVQWWGFTGCIGLYALLVSRVANACKPRATASPDDPAADEPTLSLVRQDKAFWVVLPFLSVFLLNAVTAHLTLDVMPLPLLWIVLLGVFLLSYIVGFNDRTARCLWPYEAAALACIALAALTARDAGRANPFSRDLAVGVGLCFAGCTFLHGWLYRIRPPGALLTRYYLANAAGGAIGGLAASLAAPLVFDDVSEYPLALMAFLAVAVGLRLSVRNRLTPSRLAYAVGLAVLGLLAGVGLFGKTERDRAVIWKARGFFGTVKVTRSSARLGDAAGVVHEFIHGTTVHGIQARMPGKTRMPTTYYTPESGGVGILQHPKYMRGEPMRVAAVGMGVGVLTAYCRSNDLYRCYEISPEVVAIATDPSLFSFLAEAPGQVEVVVGDGRKVMEKERADGDARFDVIVVDAFTGDNQPYHLSTREAFQLYFDRLNPDGILSVNISNWHLDLTPLIKAVGDAFDCPVVAIRLEPDLANLRSGSMWGFLIPKPPPGFTLPKGAAWLDFRKVEDRPLPTDEKGSFIGLVNFPWK